MRVVVGEQRHAGVRSVSRSMVLAVAACAALAGISTAVVIATRTSEPFSDVAAYWNAAERITNGASPYQSSAFNSESYHYAPWFAAAWVPLTFLPRFGVELAWVALLLAASTYSLVKANPYVASAIAPFLLWSAVIGNAQALVIAALAYGVRRASGPAWIGFAASLKVMPILFVLTYVGKRDWRKTALTLLIAAILWVPGLLFERSLPASVGGTYNLLSTLGPIPYVMFAGAAILYALWRPSWLASSVAVLAALPRVLLYDFGYLLVGARSSTADPTTPGPGPLGADDARAGRPS